MTNITNTSIFHQPSQWKSYLKEKKMDGMMMITDARVKKYCLKEFLIVSGLKEIPFLEIPEGEAGKSIESCTKIWDFLNQSGARRNSLLINFGGGSVMDTGGFAGSVYKRGIRFANVPTTLLGQADSCIGGKTGVNFRGIKNHIGTIRFPEAVLVHGKFLETLSERQWLEGCGEIVKHGYLVGGILWDQILTEGEHLMEAIRANPVPWVEIQLDIKSSITSKDPYEKNLREVLNLGHTAGHSLESLYLKKDQNLSHGQAVLSGMLMECLISENMGLMKRNEKKELVSFLMHVMPLVKILKSDTPALIAAMFQDKKNRGETIVFSLPISPGKVKIGQAPDIKTIKKAIEEYLELL